MAPWDGLIGRVDRWQRRTPPAGFVMGVTKKFGDDRGGALAAELTYYGFLSLFPVAADPRDRARLRRQPRDLRRRARQRARRSSRCSASRSARTPRTRSRAAASRSSSAS